MDDEGRLMRPSKLNRVLLRKLIVIVLLMFAFGYAMIPMYKQICESLGVNNLLAADVVAKSSVIDKTRWVTVEFDANQKSTQPWKFRPLTSSLRFHPGELQQVLYEVRNESSRTVVLQAVPSYAPSYAESHFKKLECFCFKQQKFAPGEVRKMPVVFVVDRDLPAEVSTLTLSYTFFEVEGLH